MRALERHLQSGDTLDVYPPSYEDRRIEAWYKIRLVRAEVTEVLGAPFRGFDANVVDAYGTTKNTVPSSHPCTSLGTSPKNDDCKFNRNRFLESGVKIRTITLPIFFPEKRTKRGEDDLLTDDAGGLDVNRFRPIRRRRNQ